jgi:hypothetical protein
MSTNWRAGLTFPSPSPSSRPVGSGTGPMSRLGPVVQAGSPGNAAAANGTRLGHVDPGRHTQELASLDGRSPVAVSDTWRHRHRAGHHQPRPPDLPRPASSKHCREGGSRRMPTATDARASRAVMKVLAASFDAFRHSIPLQERQNSWAALCGSCELVVRRCGSRPPVRNSLIAFG